MRNVNKKGGFGMTIELLAVIVIVLIVLFIFLFKTEDISYGVDVASGEKCLGICLDKFLCTNSAFEVPGENECTVKGLVCCQNHCTSKKGICTTSCNPSKKPIDDKSCLDNEVCCPFEPCKDDVNTKDGNTEPCDCFTNGKYDQPNQYNGITWDCDGIDTKYCYADKTPKYPMPADRKDAKSCHPYPLCFGQGEQTTQCDCDGDGKGDGENDCSGNKKYCINGKCTDKAPTTTTSTTNLKVQN